MQRFTAFGNLGKDPEIIVTEGGSKIAKFSLAINDGYFNNNKEWVEKTTWVNCVAFGRKAERVEKNYSKGDSVYIEGKISVTSKESDGKTTYYTNINCNAIRDAGRIQRASDDVSDDFTPDDDQPF